MQVSSISFGRAIKINTSPEIAKRIAKRANVANYDDFSTNPKIRRMEEFLSDIFNDTQLPNGKARVVELEDNDVYIFSGREAEAEEKLRKEAEEKYKQEQMEEMQQEKAKLEEERAESAKMMAELQALKAQLEQQKMQNGHLIQ